MANLNLILNMKDSLISRHSVLRFSMRNLALSVSLLFLCSAASFAQRRIALYAIGFYNLENLFDTEHDEGKNDQEYLPDGDNHWNEMKYTHKLTNMSRALADMATDRLPGLGCAIIGVSEVENAHCLTDLCAQEPLAKRGYKFVHIEGPDKRGVDCALLYNPRFFNPAKYWLQPYVLREDINSRPTRGFLTVQGTLGGDSLTVIVCHWPSRMGASPLREWAGDQVRALKDSILAANPKMGIAVMGDLNDDPFSPSIAKNLGARRKISDVTDGEMYNPWWQILLDGPGTLMWDGKWNLFDQIILSSNLLDIKGTKAYNHITFYRAEVQRLPYLLHSSGANKGAPKRTHQAGIWLDGFSDHLPVAVFMAKNMNK